MADAKQVRANIKPKIHGEMIRAARRLGMHIKDFIEQAILAKLGEFDVHLECKKLRACNTTLSVEKEQFRSERDAANRELQEATRQVGELQDECDKLDRENILLTSERDETRDARSAALQERDTFKAKSEENASALAVCEEKIELLLDRGLCDRIVNALPWVETKESREG